MGSIKEDRRSAQVPTLREHLGLARMEAATRGGVTAGV